MATAEVTYVQGGAEYTHTGKATKAGLKRAIAADPHDVWLYDTSAFAEWQKYTGPADQLPKGYVFNVVGPNPYNSRLWYASIKWGRNGKLTVT